MPVWKERDGWRYRFQYQGRKYYNIAARNQPPTYKTKAAARAAEAEHKAELKQKTPVPIHTTFSALANEYLDYCQVRNAPKTYKYKAYVFSCFLAFADDLPLDQLNLPLLEAYLRTRHSNINANRHRKDLCALISWACTREYLDRNPCHFLKKLPEPRFVRQIPTPEEMSRIMLAAGEERDFLLVLYHTLARLDEALRLRWEDVNFTERTVTLWTRKRKDGSWQSDTLPMNQVLHQVLYRLWQNRQQEDWVFYNPKTGTRYRRRPKLMKTICRRAGVRPFGFHAIRHYVASLLHDREKISLPQVSKLLRHQSKRTTELYLRVVDPASREALAALEKGFFPKAPLAGSPESQENP